MPSSGFIADSFVANEQPSTAKWNELWGNDNSFNNGNGFNDAILVTRHFALSNLQIIDKTINPYKFAYYRNAALNSANASSTPIAFDTKIYDTGNNYSTDTNLFTAPVAGFYQFLGQGQVGEAGGGGHRIFASLYKNGVELIRGDDFTNPGTTNGVGLTSRIAHPPISLNVNDTISMNFFTSGVLAFNVGAGPSYTYFGGYLVSQT